MDFVLVGEQRPGKTIYGSSWEDSLFSSLKLSSDDGLQRVQKLLKSGVDLEFCYRGVTFLGAASYLGRYDIVNAVIQFIQQDDVLHLPKKAQLLNCYDINGYTSLLLAINGNHLDVCRLLVESGADINLPHQASKQTPLIVAIEHAQLEITNFLLDNNADVHIVDNVGISPLYAAIKCKSLDTVRRLIEAECDVNIGSQDHAPIFLATRIGQLDIVKMLCKAGCYKDVRNKYGVTSVYEAALKGQVEVLEYLLEECCSPNMADMYDQTPLHVAVLQGYLPCVKLLVEAGANWKLRNQHRETPIDIAMTTGKHEILEYFLEEGIDILSRMSHPSSLKPLVAVFEQGHVTTLQVLIRGCAKMPIPHCLGVLPVFRNNGGLLRLLLLSGIQTVPGNLLVIHSSQSKEDADWLKEFTHNPRSLQDICRIRVRRSLGNKVLYGVQKLPLPSNLKNFIAMKNYVI